MKEVCGTPAQKEPEVLEMRKTSVSKKGWRLVEAVVDSGAEESVADPEQIPGELVPSAMSKAKQCYRAANNSPIPNLGQKSVQFSIDEGHACGIPFQCAQVYKPLISASQLALAGNDVVFNTFGGKIVNTSTRKVIKLVKRGGVYLLRMWVRDQQYEPAGFPRQGR